MSEGVTILSKLKKRYLRLRIAETLLLTAAVAIISYCALSLFNSSFLNIIIAFIGGIITFVFRFINLSLHKITEKSVASFLNTTYAELNSSTDLMLVPEDQLSSLTKIQLTKTRNELDLIQTRIRFPNRLLACLVFTLVSIAVLLFLKTQELSFSFSENNSIQTESDAIGSVTKNIPAGITDAKIIITPPTYTRLKSFGSESLNITTIENSLAEWNIEFSGIVKSVGLVTTSQDTLKFTFDNNSWKLSSRLDRNGFYQLIWNDGELHTSDYYKIELTKDQPPVIKLNSLNQFTQVTHDSKQILEANPNLSDDYGLTDAYIIATVSKGSGESVKFREEKIRFSTPQQISGKQISGKRALDLKALGLEPGDELYFYIEAIDTKTPVANRSRTETYFISVIDTAENVMMADGGLGVDLMPEYFRSQRQIIIDTEKLIREKKTINKKEFNFRSNELGYDQKVLRLRYGQFLGEEAESGIAPASNQAEEEHHDEDEEEDLTKEFSHQHDTENEHNLVEEKNSTRKEIDAEKDELLKGFVHNHDNEESATLFIQSLKLKLKAALAQMWDAELYLRLYEPEKSLPYQYTALRLLKEISNDSRIYVHRTGFEPPPIKEEKRLSADLTEIPDASRTYETEPKRLFPRITEALQITEKILTNKSRTIPKADQLILTQSGNELAQAAIENPALLEGLNALKNLTSDSNQNSDVIKNLEILKKSYWLALPAHPAQSGKKSKTLHTLDEQFIRNLDSSQP